MPYEVELVRRASHDAGGRDDDTSSAAGSSSVAPEQVQMWSRNTLEFRVNSTVWSMLTVVFS